MYIYLCVHLSQPPTGFLEKLDRDDEGFRGS